MAGGYANCVSISSASARRPSAGCWGFLLQTPSTVMARSSMLLALMTLFLQPATTQLDYAQATGSIEIRYCMS